MPGTHRKGRKGSTATDGFDFTEIRLSSPPIRFISMPQVWTFLRIGATVTTGCKKYSFFTALSLPYIFQGAEILAFQREEKFICTLQQSGKRKGVESAAAITPISTFVVDDLSRQMRACMDNKSSFPYKWPRKGLKGVGGHCLLTYVTGSIVLGKPFPCSIISWKQEWLV